MRTTVTLDPDTEHLIRRLMAERRMSFKEAVNHAIRRGLMGVEERRFETKTHSMGPSRVNLDKALRLAAELEDEELIRRMRAGK